jgi:uncharacterized membrane protein
VPRTSSAPGTSGKLTPAFRGFRPDDGSLYDWLVFFGVGLGAAAVVNMLVFVAFLNVLVHVLRVLAVSIAIGRTATGSSTAAA